MAITIKLHGHSHALPSSFKSYTTGFLRLIQAFSGLGTPNFGVFVGGLL
jgi:hypothetical protein